MKIAIPVDSNKNGTGVCMSFGRTPYFLIYDTKSGESRYIENQAATKSGGAGIKAAQSVVDSEVGALIAMRCGENAAEVLKSANIKIYKAVGTSVKSNIDAFAEGKLEELKEISPGQHK
ncbi:MAG TPA: NifB/NifX family molybdenum-iron cluster-binding protein [Anaerovoracaceae bacterium]|nr:NifB/NifX family molybdenum-iron cluster-binding protein [Anaerovoracaceae bacterium]